MKYARSSKNVLIRHKSELVHQFGDLLENEPEFSWVTPVGSGDPLHLVEVHLDGRIHQFTPVYILKPQILELESLLKTWSQTSLPLLVVAELSPRLEAFCRKQQLAVIDLNGGAYIRVDGLLIDRHALPNRNFRFELEPRNIFVGKSASIIRILLTDRDRVWKQSEIISATGASCGLVSRIVHYLVGQAYLERLGAREFRLGDPIALIEAWAKADDMNRRVSTTRYAVLTDNPLEIARKLNQWAEKQLVGIAFTQWLAAWLRHAYTEPVIASAYVGRLPEPPVLEELSLRPVNEAGKVWLHVPEDNGVFLATRRVQDLPIVSDAQICIDLQNTGLRGPDAAAALLNWEGFCRP